MFKRSIKLSNNSSFFLFGARGTGKTFLLNSQFSKENSVYIDLLDPETYLKYSLRPSSLTEYLSALDENVEWVIIDEIQKIPSLLDVVHQSTGVKEFKFALTGSSARKLKRGGANLLAGRAFVYNLFPLTHKELDERFVLKDILRWGALPGIFNFTNDNDRNDYLRSYAHSYIKEEINEEQTVRKLEPFRRFLYIAAQMNGKIINFSKIARDSGTSTPTIQSYFQVLEDTLIGFMLDSYHTSVRKSQRENPKFYFFDTGVLQALRNTLSLDIQEHTYAFGDLFENFIVNEINRLQQYEKKDYRLYYLRTKYGLEIDLIIEKPDGKKILVEIKSTDNIKAEHINSILKLSKDIKNNEAYCLSLDKTPGKIENVYCLHWREGIDMIMCK